MLEGSRGFRAVGGEIEVLRFRVSDSGVCGRSTPDHFPSEVSLFRVAFDIS